jgi:hypothetical protein
MATRKKKDPLRGKRDPLSQLYRAAKRYVDSQKGELHGIDGVQVEEFFQVPAWLGSGRNEWHLVIRCRGKQPDFR